MLASPDYGKPFEIYTDASTRPLGAVIIQGNRPLEFLANSLVMLKKKYNITELELLSIIECLEEFTGMLWGQTVIVYSDRTRTVLQEFQQEIIYIKGIDNSVADAINHLEYDPSANVKKIHWSRIWSVFVHILVQSDPKDLP